MPERWGRRSDERPGKSGAAVGSDGVAPRSSRRLTVVALILLLAILAACGRGDGQSAVVSGSVPAPDPGLDAGVARTGAGVVRGQVAPGYVLFQGIPYAAAPIGELR